jgi:hypothetical protein
MVLANLRSFCLADVAAKLDDRVCSFAGVRQSRLRVSEVLIWSGMALIYRLLR